MNRVEFYKDLYFKEMERKEIVNSRFQWAISIWVLLIGALLFCLTNYHKVIDGLEIIFLVLIGISLIFIIRATIFLVTYLWGNQFEYVPSATSFEERYIEIHEHYVKYPDYTHLIDETFEKEVNEILRKCATRFQAINNKSITLLIKSIQLLLISTLFLSWSFLILIPDFLKKEEPVTKIEVIEIHEKNKNIIELYDDYGIVIEENVIYNYN